MKYVLALGVALLGVAALLAGLRPGADAATVTVSLEDAVFDPADIVITAGDTVVWEWNSELPHSVTADDLSFDSGMLTGSTNTFSHTFDAPGTYAYFCVVHGGAGGIGMAGTVTVQQQQNTPTATNTPGTPSATDEPTETPIVTNTPEPTFTTQTTPTAPAVLDAVPISATEPAGGADALPSSGAGGDDGGFGRVTIALAAAGALLLATAAAARLARRRA